VTVIRESLRFSTEDLAEELGQRLKPLGMMMLPHIFKAGKTDWITTTGELLQLPQSTPLPKSLRALVELPNQLNALASELGHYDPYAFIDDSAPAELRKEVPPDFQFSLTDLWRMHRNLSDRPGYAQTQQLSSLWLIPDEVRPPADAHWYKSHFEYLKRTIAAELEKLRNDANPPKAAVNALDDERLQKSMMPKIKTPAKRVSSNRPRRRVQLD
jgi:hypothetical protein